MIMPIVIQHNVPTCPQCGQPLHQGGEPSFWVLLLIIFGGAILFMWIMSTCYEWLFEQKPLFTVFVEQWHWIKSARLW